MGTTYNQLHWEQQDQNAYITFSQVSTETELLPYIISNQNKHLHYRDLTSFNTHYFDDNFILIHFETSDNKPYSTSNINSKTSFDEYVAT